VTVRETADVETSSDAYAQRFSGAIGAWFLDLQARHLRDLLGHLPRGSRVLDVGGGHAQLVPMLVEAGFAVTVLGSDPSCSARLRPWLDSGACRFDAGDLLALPYPDRAFDAVLSFRLLPHVADCPRLVSELCRVAGRHVVVDYPSRRSVNVLADRLFVLKKGVEGDTRPFTLFDPPGIAAAFTREGFRIAGERGQFFWPMALHRAIGSAIVARLLEWMPRATGLTQALGSPRIARADRRTDAT
jgi:SAM-dependent methyltransferase